MDKEALKELTKMFKIYYPREWMNKEQACKYIGIANNTYDSKFMDIPYHDVNGTIRYSKSEIDDFIKNH